MEDFKNILFFSDGARGEKGALARAIELAELNKASLTAIAVVPELGTNDVSLSQSIRSLQKALVAERANKLDQLIAETNTGSLKIATQVVPGDKDFIEVIRRVVESKHDLLMKSVDKASAISAVLFGNHDLRLMRQCPCPVWIIKPERRKTLATVMAAIDVTSNEKPALELARRIVDSAETLAKREGAELHMVAAWHQPVEPSLRRQMDPKAYEELVSFHRTEIKRRFEHITGAASHPQTHTHLIRGKPESVLTRFVTDYDVDLLIMGTLSRSGIPGLLIGNTAERVLNAVNCSVLTMKPRGFRTVIK